MGRAPGFRRQSISSVVFNGTAAKLVTARDPQGLPRSLAYDDYNNFAPRVGFAYNPKLLGGRTVVRGAYGIFYQRELANTWIDLAINDPFIRQTNFNLDLDPASSFYWGRYDLTRPTALAPSIPLLVFSVDSNWRDGMIHQWNFNIQQSLGFALCCRLLMWAIAACACRVPRCPTSPIPVRDRWSRGGLFAASARSTAWTPAATRTIMAYRCRPRSGTRTACSSWRVYLLEIH